MMSLSPLNKSLLAAGALALVSSASLAADNLSSLVHAGGEAMSPEAEMRMNALLTSPGGALTRDEVRQELAAAREAGALADGGEAGDTPHVLAARDDSNTRQTRAILAAHEAERQRLAALEAERLAREQAAATALAAASPDTAAEAPAATAAAAGPDAQAAASADTAVSAPIEGTVPGDRPADRPDTPAPAAPAPTLTLRDGDDSARTADPD
jgi:biotin carboxyl carrier protein